MRANRTRSTLLPLLTLAPLLGMAVAHAAPAAPLATPPARQPGVSAETATPIRHLVVIYQENVSFDHYFATYPQATNPQGEPVFTALKGTPKVNNLRTAKLLKQNPNTNPQNGADAALPFRLDRTQASTADQNHAYTAEQQAYNGGKVDLFPLHTGRGSAGGVGAFGTKGQVMGYFDGNTVTALWHYAQRFAMSDTTYTDDYGPSTPGALAVVSGQTNGLKIIKAQRRTAFIDDGQGGYTMVNDIDPAYDTCSTVNNQVMMTSRNIGDLLNEHDVSWGGFMGGFNLAAQNDNGSSGCGRHTYSSVVAINVPDYIPHHNWFQYYKSTSNPTHARPDSVAAIGHTHIPGTETVDAANHEYDLDDFYTTVKAGNFPAVSFIKLPAYQDGHAGYSDPLDEQAGIVKLVNFIQQQPGWAETAVIIAYDDSDGWYDHAFTPVQHGSFDSKADQLDGPGVCGPKGSAPIGVAGKPVNGRCGPGTRLPLIVISPWAKQNYVSHDLLTQSSITRFIEDNWLHGERLGGGSYDATSHPLTDLFDFAHGPQLIPLLLDPKKGTVRAEPKQTF